MRLIACESEDRLIKMIQSEQYRVNAQKKQTQHEWQHEYKLKHNSRSKPLTWSKKNNM